MPEAVNPGSEPPPTWAQSRFPGGGGSRRDDASHHAVLDATRQLLVEIGYSRLTVEAIARRAGVAKPTIYRWWKNKAAIVDESVWARRASPVVSQGDLVADLKTHIDRATEFFSRPSTIAALPGFLAGGFEPTPESALARHTRTGIAPLRNLLLEAQRAGTIDADVDIGMVTDMIIGGLLSRALARSLTTGRPTGTRAADGDALLALALRTLGVRDLRKEPP